MTTATASPRTVVPLWLIAMIAFSGTLGMHIFVPALQLVASDLHTTPAAVQLTIGVYILGLAAGQLVIGPISDRYGRRPVLMAGLCVYTLASAVCLVAPDINSLIVARLFQSLGGCTGLVLSRAIARDGTALSDAAKRLASLNLIVVIGPGVAPIIGGALAAFVGWRWIFAALALFGLFLLLLTSRRLRETGDVSQAQSARIIMRNYARLCVTPAFLGFAIGGGCATTSIYGFTAAAPFIFIEQLHRPAHEVGLYLAGIFFAIWCGSLIARRLAGRVSVSSMMLNANLLAIAGAALFLVFTLAGALSVPMVIATTTLFSLGTGIAAPSSLAEAISVDTRVIGSAAGVYGFVQMLIGAICTTATGFGTDHALTSAIVLTVASVIAQVAYRIAVAMRPKPPGSPASTS